MLIITIPFQKKKKKEFILNFVWIWFKINGTRQNVEISFSFFFFSITQTRRIRRSLRFEVLRNDLKNFPIHVHQWLQCDSSQKIRNSFLFFTIYVPFSNIRYSKRRRAERTKIWHIKSIEIIPICICILICIVRKRLLKSLNFREMEMNRVLFSGYASVLHIVDLVWPEYL